MLLISIKEFIEISIAYSKLLTRQGFKRWAIQNKLNTKITIVLVVAAVFAGFITYTALTTTATEVSTQTVFWLFNLDLVILLLLGTIIARQIASLWSGRRRGLAGSRLHVRLVSIFCLLAAVPAILMAVFSATFFFFGVQNWFSERVSTAVNESIEVAEAYLEEHQKVIRADILAMANDLNREAPRIAGNPSAFQQFLQTQSDLRNLPEAVVFNSSGQILVRSNLSFSFEFTPISNSLLENARNGDVVLMTSDEEDRVRALIKLNNYFDTFLFVGRLVEPGVLTHMETAQSAVREYTELEGRKSQFMIMVTAMYAAVALLLMLGAVWVGLLFARQLIKPISALIVAAERVRAGDLTARVGEDMKLDEFTTLGRTFDRMTSQLRTQRNELVEANRQIDQRRRFIEAVLAGVTSGVISLNSDGLIITTNEAAASLLNLESKDGFSNKLLIDFLPQIKESLEKAYKNPNKIIQTEVKFKQEDVATKTLLARITVEESEDGIEGAVVTLDDISELLSAQRKAAWADVARRIAHEIKNPLTPIQLSAERLRRKYLGQIQEDPETFEHCTETIVRQVSDIGRMVDEFSSFARMPEPVKKVENVVSLCKDSLFLQRQAHPEILFSFHSEPESIFTLCDRRQVQQALTNLLQNAIESIETRQSIEQRDAQEVVQGQITVEIYISKKDEVVIFITDNGMGLPDKETRDKLTEPYVTTRQKGTGLGLAIVQKILEDHGGNLYLNDREDGEIGATITLILSMAIKEELYSEETDRRYS